MACQSLGYILGLVEVGFAFLFYRNLWVMVFLKCLILFGPYYDEWAGVTTLILLLMI